MQTGADRLRHVGLRVTRQRLAVLEEVGRRPHSGVPDIATAVRTRLGSISTQAVYDVLAALTDAGLLRHIEPAGSSARFELSTGDNHHHLVCRNCAAIADVDCVTGQPPCLHPGDCHGYAVDEAEVTFWGLCPRCRPRPDGAPADTHLSDTPA